MGGIPMKAIVSCVLFATLVACTDKPDARDTALLSANGSLSDSPAKVHPVGIDRTLQLPGQLVLSPVIKVQRAESWRDFASRQAQSDRDTLAEVSARYWGVVEFSSPEEQQLLASRGFPMPEEWIAAAAMSIEELERQASAGNVKAQMFYSDRLSSELLEIQRSRTGIEPPDGVTVDQLVASSAKSLAVANQMMRSSSSPFAAYVYGRALSGASFGAPPEPIAGSYFAARDRGDLRANRLMQDFLQQHKSLNMQSVMATYSIMAMLEPEGA